MRAVQRNLANIEIHRRKKIKDAVLGKDCGVFFFFNTTKQGELHMPFVNALLTTQVQ